MSDTVERFSNRVENYVKYRPSYPTAVLQLFKDKMGLTESSVVADIGSGPGISARLFLENGNIVYGVEPNSTMRQAAGSILSKFPNFKSIDGTAEATALPTSSVDFVVASQAFHWFDPDAARAEFLRIVKDGGYIGLIWNERQMETTPFLCEYEQFILRNAKDYEYVRHDNISAQDLEAFFQKEFHSATFENVQIFDFEGLKGRMLSASYMPSETDRGYSEMIDELRELFAKHAESGKIKVFYDTNVFYSKY